MFSTTEKHRMEIIDINVVVIIYDRTPLFFWLLISLRQHLAKVLWNSLHFDISLISCMRRLMLALDSNFNFLVVIILNNLSALIDFRWQWYPFLAAITPHLQQLRTLLTKFLSYVVRVSCSLSLFSFLESDLDLFLSLASSKIGIQI